MYITLMPVIFAGIFNMVWCKAPILKSISIPMDGNRNLRDGKRIFGDNKTWKGFLGMILFGILCTVAWGLINRVNPFLSQHNYFYANYENTIVYNLMMGAMIGFAYALFELPNSFIKRRLDITPGKTLSGIYKVLFIFLDQADSIFGCVLVICIVYKMPVWFYFAYVLLGAGTHIIINMLLYACKLRQNMF